MPTMHKRCIYVSPDTGLECELWFASDDANQHLCALHAGFISAALASNGTNKDSYIAKRNEAMFSVAEAIKGLSDAEAYSLCAAHQAKIERAIEDMKIEALAWRGKQGELLDGMSEAERKERRKIQAPKRESVEKKRVNRAAGLGADMLAKEKAILSLMKTGKTREQAIAIWEMD